jgi:molybdopterin-guanine dinucleotide biosynthesis protein A
MNRTARVALGGFPKIPAVILAGGRSRRMGGADKALLPLRGRAMIEHVIAALAPQTSAILINSNGDPRNFSRFGQPVMADDIGGHLGPLAGILTGMYWARTLGASHLVSAPVDVPFLPDDLVSKLSAADGIAFAVAGGQMHPVLALWPVALASRLADDLRRGEAAGVQCWLERAGAAAVEFPDPARFANINHPEDLRQADQGLSPYFPESPAGAYRAQGTTGTLHRLPT